jgi:TetR/AcrR family fatty acid metabolism transcriptional regulator
MNKKELIANKFLELFDKNSFDEIDLKLMGKELNLKINDYFNSKYDILEFVLKDKLKEKIKMIKSINDKDVNLQNKLIMFFDYHFDFLKNHPQISDLLIKTSMIEKNKELKIIKSYMENFKSTFSELIQEEIKKQKIRNVDPDIIASAILHATHGVTVRIKYDDSYDYAKAKKELINFIYLGLNN